MGTVTSKDGTRIAYDRRGQGPALILVDGALCYRSFGPMPGLAELLAPRFTVYNYDRRGRGESGDTPPYSLERETEDIEALIQEAGGSAFVFGISSGGALALESAARLDDRIRKLAMYEPPYISEAPFQQAWRDYRRELNQLLAEGKRGEAAALFMKSVGTPEEQVQGMQHAPIWPMFEAVAPTLAYDAAALGEDRSVPAQRAGQVMVPTLVLNGTVIPFMRATAETLAEAIPGARQLTLEGQPHDVDSNVLAPQLVEFFLENGNR
jgi:pimeloyl-ACP methyl ester carboxylesterase